VEQEALAVLEAPALQSFLYVGHAQQLTKIKKKSSPHQMMRTTFYIFFRNSS
jgi:hypothetical protein